MYVRNVGFLFLLLGLHQTATGQEQLNPAEIADRIEGVAKRYRSVRYSTIFNLTRSANPFQREKDPKLVTGNGRTSYTRFGDKWVVDVRSFSVSLNSGKKSKTHTGGGFDGRLHWHRGENEITLSEEFSGGSNYDPVELFWHGARNKDWLLAALRKESARVIGTEEIEGLQCLKIESAFGEYRFRFSISPKAAFLPLRSECAIGGTVQGVETLSQVQQSKEGLWYPRRIRIEHPALPVPFAVKRIAVRNLEAVESENAETFKPSYELGTNIVDHTRGYAFHNDPWWPELEPVLRRQFDWPRADLSDLRQMSSYGATSGGKPVPPIIAAEWINKDPGKWDRKERKVTVVFFYGGRAIRPTPKWWSNIRRLHEIYGRFGLDVIGVTPATDEPEVVKAAARMMNVSFPIAIDTKHEGGYGRTFDAFGLKPYTGVFVVDHKGLLNTIEQKNTVFEKPSELESVVRKLLADAGSAELPKVVLQNDQRIGNVFRQVLARWKNLVPAGTPNSSISGIVSGGYDAKGPTPLAGATVEIEPFLKMLGSNILGSYVTGSDRARKRVTETDEEGKYRFENLPKGYYRIAISANGRAFEKQDLLVAQADGVTHNAALPAEHTIVGRVVSADDKLSIEDAVIKITGRHPDPDNPDIVTRSFPQPTTTVDADGTFAFEYLQSGAYILEISANGFQKREMRMIPLSEKEVVIELQKQKD